MSTNSTRSNKPSRKLLKAYLSNRCTKAEKAFVEQWYSDFAAHQLSKNSPSSTDQIGIRMWARIESSVTSSPRIWSRSTWMRVAASVTIMLTAGLIWLWNNSNETHSESNIVYGKTAATIMLDSEGNAIYLDSTFRAEELRDLGIHVEYENGKAFYALSPSVKGTIENYTITTRKGEEIQLVLPDQSRVWVNAASQLSFATTLGTDSFRDVYLEGEAYFEVIHQPNIPFRVHAKNAVVEVLGTSFNVSAYSDQSAMETTLLEGSVRLGERVLTPGQSGIYDGSAITVAEVDVENAIAWKNGYFNLNGVAISTVVKQIENWYNVEFQLDERFKNETLHGMIPKYQDLEKVLNIFEKAGLGKFKIEGRRVITMS
jgi:transmembrane sensor